MKKYRVWNKTTKQWVHGPNEEVHLFGETILLGHFMDGVGIMELNDCVPLEYIGIKDKNGKEIYEGDFVRCGKFRPVEVYYDNHYCGFYPFILRLDEERQVLATDPEIVGNKFENSELLK